MNFESDQIYHVYNRGNQKQTIFFEERNFLLFLRKIRKELLPFCDIVVWCLMPNHFHLIIYAKQKGCLMKLSGSNEIQELSYRIGILLSSYTSVVNKEKDFSGSLFQKKTKAKHLASSEDVIRCMHYVHQNPLVAGLTHGTLEEWKYSSFLDYCGLRKGTLCNFERLFSMPGYEQGSFLKDSYSVIDSSVSDLFY